MVNPVEVSNGAAARNPAERGAVHQFMALPLWANASWVRREAREYVAASATPASGNPPWARRTTARRCRSRRGFFEVME